jgi:tetratricopeptide (TPR) repeat protein
MLCAAASFLSKEQGAVCMLLVPLLPGLTRRERIIGFACLVTVVAAVMAWRVSVLGALGPLGTMQVLPQLHLVERIPVALHFLGNYVRLAVWPRPLLFEYDDPEISVQAGLVDAWVFVGAGAALLLPALWYARAWRAAFACALFLVPLAPVLNLVYRTGETFAERFLCLPLAGFALAASIGCQRLGRRAPALATGALGLLAVLLGSASFGRAHDWTSQARLYAAQLADAPEMAGSHFLVAGHLLDEFAPLDPTPDDYARALASLERAVEISPARVDAVVSLGQLLLHRAAANPAGPPRDADLRRAEELLEAARRVPSQAKELHRTLGDVYLVQGRRQEAEIMLRLALEVDPRDFRAAASLARLLDDSGRRDDASAIREQVVQDMVALGQSQPWQSGPWRVAAGFAHALGDDARALELMQRALEVGETGARRVETVIDFTRFLRDVGRSEEARRLLEETAADLQQELARSDPAVTLLVAAASLEQELGRADRARELLEQARSATGPLGDALLDPRR